MNLRLLLLAFVSIAAFAVLPATAQVLTVPASWAGVWEFTDTERPCGQSGGDVSSDSDTLCAGDSIDFDDIEGLTCDGSVTDTSLNWSCSITTSEGGCTITIAFSVQVTRNGDTITGTETFSIDYEGCPPGLDDECTEIVTTGNRTGPEPENCMVPVETTTWGRLKTLYN